MFKITTNEVGRRYVQSKVSDVGNGVDIINMR